MITKINIDDDSSVGRLGNKLFIIAACKSIADKQNTNFCLPQWKYGHFFKNIPVGDIPSIHSIYTEPKFTYTPIDIDCTSKNVSLNGYFQSDKYFSNKNDIIRLFEIYNVELPPIKYSDYIAIHVRRGDYLKVSHVHNNLCNTKYYENAINLTNHNKFIVFSDDITFCKSYFAKFIDKTFIYTENTTELQDLYAMTLCKGNIIANSSFSWWGAYLNKNGIINIMPREWFTNDCIDSSDLCPIDWIVV